MDDQQFARELCIDMNRLKVFIVRGWILPLTLNGERVFRDVDLARAALIGDLANEMGVNDEGVDVALDLIDQLYSLRFAFKNLLDTLEREGQGASRPRRWVTGKGPRPT